MITETFRLGLVPGGEEGLRIEWRALEAEQRILGYLGLDMVRHLSGELRRLVDIADLGRQVRQKQHEAVQPLTSGLREVAQRLHQDAFLERGLRASGAD